MRRRLRRKQTLNADDATTRVTHTSDQAARWVTSHMITCYHHPCTWSTSYSFGGKLTWRTWSTSKFRRLTCKELQLKRAPHNKLARACVHSCFWFKRDVWKPVRSAFVQHVPIDRARWTPTRPPRTPSTTREHVTTTAMLMKSVPVELS